MFSALIILCLTYLIREVMHQRDHKHWQDERKDLYSRIQAGSLQEYEQVTRKPSVAVIKTRDQLVAEEAHEKGLAASDLRYPSQWK